MFMDSWVVPLGIEWEHLSLPENIHPLSYITEASAHFDDI